MPEPVAVDTATLKALMERLTRTADELAVLPIASLEALPGSALGDLDAPCVSPPKCVDSARPYRIGFARPADRSMNWLTLTVPAPSDFRRDDRAGPR